MSAVRDKVDLLRAELMTAYLAPQFSPDEVARIDGEIRELLPQLLKENEKCPTRLNKGRPKSIRIA